MRSKSTIEENTISNEIEINDANQMVLPFSNSLDPPVAIKTTRAPKDKATEAISIIRADLRNNNPALLPEIGKYLNRVTSKPNFEMLATRVANEIRAADNPTSASSNNLAAIIQKMKPEKDKARVFAER